MKKSDLLTFVCVALGLSGTAVAEPLGLLNGRFADINRMPEMSVEAGGQQGEYDNVDFTFFGARLNYKLNSDAVAYFDLGQAKYEIRGNFDGLAYGGGVFYQLNGVSDSADLGVHASVHKTELENNGIQNDISMTSVLIEAQLSGREAMNQSGTIFWHASVGFARASGDDPTSTEFALGAVPVSRCQQWLKQVNFTPVSRKLTA